MRLAQTISDVRQSPASTIFNSYAEWQAYARILQVGWGKRLLRSQTRQQEDVGGPSVSHGGLAAENAEGEVAGCGGGGPVTDGHGSASCSVLAAGDSVGAGEGEPGEGPGRGGDGPGAFFGALRHRRSLAVLLLRQWRLWSLTGVSP